MRVVGIVAFGIFLFVSVSVHNIGRICGWILCGSSSVAVIIYMSILFISMCVCVCVCFLFDRFRLNLLILCRSFIGVVIIRIC